MIRVLIVDDHEIMRQGLTLLFNSASDTEVVGEARDGLEALDLCDILHPDVIVMDIVMPKMDGMTTTRILRERLSTAKIIIFSVLNDRVLSQLAMYAGANRVLHKSVSGTEILEAVRAIYEMS